MSMFSQTTEYAVRAMIELARDPKRAQVLAADLAERLGIPHHYLAKILQLLVRARLLNSTRGRLGGFAMAREAKEITLYEVIAPFEDLAKLDECILGEATCTDDRACPLHNYWKSARERYLQELEQRNLSELAEFQSVLLAKKRAEPGPNKK